MTVTPDSSFDSNSDGWGLFGGQWERSLRANNLAPRTIKDYLKSYGKLREWATAQGFEAPEELKRTDLESFFADQLEMKTTKGTKKKASYVAIDFRQIRVFYGWLAEIEEMTSPMTHLKAPKIPETPVPVMTLDDLKKLLDACKPAKGKASKNELFACRRDLALIRLLFDTGARRSELAYLTMSNIDLKRQTITVMGKGRRERTIPYGNKTALAVDAYMRVRFKHKDKQLDAFWLAASPHSGAITGEGVHQMLKRRARLAEVDGRIYQHRLRHTAAHMRLADGMSEGDAMRIFGWKSRTMVDRYGSSAADARAIEAARKSSPADEV